MNTIGERIKNLRTAEKLSLQELAALVGKSKSNISGYENDKFEPSAQTIIALSKHFNVTCDWILNGDSFQKENTPEIYQSLSIDESELIDTYRKLDRRGKAKVITVSYEELDRIEAQESTNKTDKIPKTTNVVV